MMDVIFFDKLSQFGVFGLWTAFNIYLIMMYLRKEKRIQEMQEKAYEKMYDVIERNTQVITKFLERQENYCFNRDKK